MRNFQARFADPLVPVYQNIQIQRPWPVANALRAIPAKFLLNPEQPLEQGAGVELRLQRHHSVEKSGLIGQAHRRGRIEGRTGDYVAQGLQALRGRG